MTTLIPKIDLKNGGTTPVGAINRTINEKSQDILSVKDFGAVGDGNVDDTTAIQNAINYCPQYGAIFFPAGTYVVSTTLTIGTNNIKLYGPAILKAKASTNFDYILSATSLSGIIVEELTFDANKTNRTSGQTIRFMGAGFISCTDSSFINCTALNTRGYGSISAVGIAIGGTSIRCLIQGCRAENCGDSPSNASDGFYTSGNQNVLANSIATNCVDTGFVIESSNNSIITGCTANLCGAGAAVTNAINPDVYGNIINGLTIFNWTGGSGVTGGIQIGTPLSTSTGSLYDTSISNVVMYANTGSGYGLGPAINIRKTGTPQAVNVSLSDIMINGATTQGVLVDGQEITVDNATVKGLPTGVGSAGIVFSSGISHIVSDSYIFGCDNGVVTNNVSSVVLQNNFLYSQVNYGILGNNTSTIRAIFNFIGSPGNSNVHTTGSASLNLIGANSTGNALAINNATGSGVSGSIVNKFQIFDANGNSLGYVPIYNS